MQVATIGIDPGSESGVSVWLDGELHSFIKISVPHIGHTHRLAALRNVGEKILKSLHTHHVKTVVEDQWLGKNPQTQMRTVESAVCWQLCAHMLGLNPVAKRVAPASWRARFSLNRKSKSEIVDHVRTREPLAARLGENCCEAVLIGLYQHLRDLRDHNHTAKAIALHREWQ